MSKRVFLHTRDLTFRSKLRAVVTTGGGAVTREAAEADLVVVELESERWQDQVQAGVARGKPVLVFGSHVDVEGLRGARALGADAVPNSHIEARLSAQLREP
jgi:hypothetical protein